MATRSTITIKTEAGYQSTYCHWDGYPTHVGKILSEHYTDPAKIKFLIELGALSSLKKEVGPDVGQIHTFDHPHREVTVAYHRDRGDALVVGEVHPSLQHAIERSPSGEFEEYNYLFRDGEWFVLSRHFRDERGNSSFQLFPLTEVLASPDPDNFRPVPTIEPARGLDDKAA